jgi:hypothetical protein
MTILKKNPHNEVIVIDFKNKIKAFVFVVALAFLFFFVTRT